MKPTSFRYLILLAILLSGFLSEAHGWKKDTTVYVVADKMPSFPGGVQLQNQFLSAHLKYPAEAVKNGISGKVFVSFIVEKKGNISHIKVVRGIGYGCDKEAERVVSEMPLWEPRILNKKPVRMRVTLPFIFNLQPEDKVYTQADQYPVFSNREPMESFIKRNMRYPEGMFKNKVIDTVNVYYIVEPDNQISHVTVRKNQDSLNAYDYEAIRLVKGLTVVRPAYIKQYPVRLMLYLPVVFNYKEADTTGASLTDVQYDGKKLAYYNTGPIFTLVEKKPSFPGGDKALMQYLASHITYPQDARIKNIQGRVFVSFVVEADGSVSHVHVLRSIYPSLDAEACYVIKHMPKWQPGMQKGKNVRVNFTLPINFAIK
ncbi:MAG: energy transducer TonB [Bacteroidales bacterium]|nr:energy transducer TonB [Bacteroidales bacterium]